MKIEIPITFVVFLLTANPLFSQNSSKLPPKAAILIEQLNDWEKERRTELESEIDAKRQQVAQLLKGHQEEATKSGDLDGALVIRETIRMLRGNPDDNRPGRDSTESKTEGDRLPVSSVWISADSKSTLTINKRDGDSFVATFTAGEHTRREIKGKLKGDQLSWRSENVRAISGGTGGDNVGTIDDKKIDLVWTSGDGQSGKFTLMRSSDSK